jgi:NitT/TauT family transport system substrate-binding protein
MGHATLRVRTESHRKNGMITIKQGILKMKTGTSFTAVAFSLTLLASPMVDSSWHHARAETNTVHIAISPGFGFLPLYVVIENKLIEKQAAAAGLPPVSVEVSDLTGGAAQNAALLAGTVDLVSSGVPPFLVLWDKTLGRGDVKALCAVGSMPLFLNTRNPAVNTIADFTENDRIALASPSIGPHATVLQMQAAKLFGDQGYNKLDHLSVGMPQPEAMAALLSGKTQVTAHFTVPPYQYIELDQPGVKRVLSSYDVLGNPSTFQMAWITTKFRRENPKLTKAMFEAIAESVDYINTNKTGTAEIYLKMTKDKISQEKLLGILNDPDIKFTLTPQNVMKQAEFMHKTGIIKTMPSSWKDLFFPEAQTLQGS